MAETELYVHELHCTNIKKLRHVAVKLQPGMNRVLGENDNGKSTFLDLVRWAIGGAKEMPGEIITRGQEKAQIVLKFGPFVIERRFHKNEKGGEESTLVLIGPDGGRLPKPQTVLEAFYDKYCFDPLAFMRMEPAKQVEVLKRLGNLSFGPLEAKRATLYEQRTEVNAKGAAAKARFLAMPATPAGIFLPEQPVDVDELLKEQNELQRVRLDNAAKRAELKAAEVEFNGMMTRQRLARERIDQLLAELASAERERDHADECVKMFENSLEKRRAATAALVDPELGDLTAKISAAQSTNLWVERREQRKKVEAELEAMRAEKDALTTAIDELDKQKAVAIAAVKFPVDGLGFTDASPVFNGFALAEASAAIQLRVSVAIGIALNPKLRLMLVRDAALMGTAQLELLKQLAVERRAQLLVEIAARDSKDLEVMIQEGDVVVVDGEVRVHGQEQLQLEPGGAA